LKGLRKAAADQNGIAYELAECHYEGECSGTCPKCEEELKTLTEQLKKSKPFVDYTIFSNDDDDN
jgi:succinate dehydrogenase/fumarate reductase-like Fe-S protein